jgi:histidine triad (HIT) family protein
MDGEEGDGRMNCVFCRIRDGELSSARVAENNRALAIMDINPITDGHVLVLTKRHAETLFEIDEEDLVAAIRLAHSVAAAIRKGLTPDGLTLIQSNGRAAHQSVWHFHIHLIPRWQGDGKGFDWSLVPGDPERIRVAADSIRAAR